MKASVLREKSAQELRELLARNRAELFGMKIRRYTGQNDKSSDMVVLKKDIARVLTILRERGEA